MKSWEITVLLAIGLYNFCTPFASAQVADLECFKCISQAGDDTCLEDPNRVTTLPISVNCDSGWCTTTRKEFTEVPGKIVTFTRGCIQTRPEFTDDIIHNAHFTTYYSTCRTMKCNSGNGLKDNRGGGGGDGGSSGIIIVPGEVNGESRVKVNLVLATISVFLFVDFQL